jgi:hypothetical protein
LSSLILGLALPYFVHKITRLNQFSAKTALRNIPSFYPRNAGAKGNLNPHEIANGLGLIPKPLPYSLHH